jgi:acyl carrier protein
MTRDEIVSKLTDIMRDVFDEDTLLPTDAMTSDDVAEWDSTNHVRLMVAIEAEFGIRFEVDEITSPESVGELIDLIASKLGTPAG